MLSRWITLTPRASPNRITRIALLTSADRCLACLLDSRPSPRASRQPNSAACVPVLLRVLGCGSSVGILPCPPRRAAAALRQACRTAIAALRYTRCSSLCLSSAPERSAGTSHNNPPLTKQRPHTRGGFPGLCALVPITVPRPARPTVRARLAARNQVWWPGRGRPLRPRARPRRRSEGEGGRSWRRMRRFTSCPSWAARRPRRRPRRRRRHRPPRRRRPGRGPRRGPGSPCAWPGQRSCPCSPGRAS